MKNTISIVRDVAVGSSGMPEWQFFLEINRERVADLTPEEARALAGVAAKAERFLATQGIMVGVSSELL